MKKLLLQKNGWLAMEIAKEFLTLNDGDRIPTVSDFCSKFDTARGTVQIALKLLEEYQALHIYSRGTLGSFIKDIDYTKLMEMADIKTIVGVMPLPYSKLYEGFASGLYQSSSKLPLYLAYMRGSKNRIELLLEKRYSFAVVSKLAAEKFMSEYDHIMIAMEFGRDTYVSDHGIIFRNGIKKERRNGLRVGIDESSIDQASLTKMCFESYDVEYVSVYYNQILEMLKEGTIDAAVWNTDELRFTELKDNYISLQDQMIMEKNTEAVLVINKDEEYLYQMIHRFIDKQTVLKIQQGVLKGELIPYY